MAKQIELLEQLEQLEPQWIWQHFVALNAVPRPSKKEAQVIAFMKDFGNRLGLEMSQDAVGNLMIKKPASAGYENRQTVVLQAHLDMVCQKNQDVDFDFDTQGIEMYVDGDWVRARGTTLGADNGMGVAAMMGILASQDIAHPEIEALFTIDEEIGMGGALGLQANWLSGKILLNLDTEEDDELMIGCAGGVDVTAKKSYPTQEWNGNAVQIRVKGLQGGHSGIDIHKGLGNANKLLARFLFLGLEHAIQLIELDGGSLRNAIPREANALIWVDNDYLDDFMASAQVLKQTIANEFSTLEPNLSIEISHVTILQPQKILSPDDSAQIVRVLNAVHHGVWRMSPDVPNLVEASNNLARVALENGALLVGCLARSSVESTKDEVVAQLKAVLGLANMMDVTLSNDYMGWQPKPSSPIVQAVVAQYRELFQSEPKVAACHAGLECGIIGAVYPEMQMISFGPTIRGAHSPDERVSVSSTQKFARLLQAVLENIPEK